MRMENLNYLLSWVCAVCEVFLCYCMVDEYTGSSFIKNHKVYSIICTLLIGTLLAYNRNTEVLVSWSMIVLESLLMILSLIVRKVRNRLLKFSIIFLYNTYIGLMQLAIVFLILITSERSVYSIYFSFGPMRNICYWISLAITFIFYKFSSTYERKENTLDAYKWILLADGIAGIAILINNQNRLLELGRYRSIETTFFLLLFICANCFGIVWGVKNASVKSKLQLLEYKDSLMEENYKEIESIYKNCAYTQHDMKNHLIVLSNYCDKGEIEKCSQYINNILEPLEKVHQYINFKDDIISIILNYKLEAASSKGIHVETDIDCIEDLGIEDHDLCSIISNLVDNAIEACEDPFCIDKVIKIGIKNLSDIIIIRVSNTYSPHLNKKRSKAGKFQLHGFGKNAVRDKVKKYGGRVEFSADDKYYHALITICRD